VGGKFRQPLTARNDVAPTIEIAYETKAIRPSVLFWYRKGCVLHTPQIVAEAAQPGRGDPLPSWNDGAAKQSILDWVTRVSASGGGDFVRPEQRLAVFDNDGTLWSEKPFYFQLAFALARVRALASQHPEWRTQEPFKTVLSGDQAALAGLGEKELLLIVTQTHSGMTVRQFQQAVLDWIAMARHPRFNRPYTDLVFQPMLELLAYLRSHLFRTYIVTGGGIEFVRPWAEKIYGIPPEQVVGSSGDTQYREIDGRPELIKLPKIEFIDDGPGKPVGINRFIGQRPLFAFGNSDGDLQMLEWITAGEGPHFAGLVHHTDAAREWAYDRDSSLGALNKAGDEAERRGWLVVDMKIDWNVIYPLER
jgi:phosphoglycolate phosphatase-like HAD superfamily hydrolase